MRDYIYKYFSCWIYNKSRLQLPCKGFTFGKTGFRGQQPGPFHSGGVGTVVVWPNHWHNMCYPKCATTVIPNILSNRNPSIHKNWVHRSKTTFLGGGSPYYSTRWHVLWTKVCPLQLLQAPLSWKAFHLWRWQPWWFTEGSGVGGLPVTKPCVVVAAASLVFSFITCGGVKLNLLHALHPWKWNNPSDSLRRSTRVDSCGKS